MLKIWEEEYGFCSVTGNERVAGRLYVDEREVLQLWVCEESGVNYPYSAYDCNSRTHYVLAGQSFESAKAEAEKWFFDKHKDASFDAVLANAEKCSGPTVSASGKIADYIL